MPWKTSKVLFLRIRHAVLFLAAALVLAGCTVAPWTDPLQDTEAEKIALQVDELAARNAACGNTLEGDVALFYQSPLGKKALDGFLKFSMPSSYKFVMTNPFGQPVLIIAGDQDSFQVINTLSKNYLVGSILSFGLQNNIPTSFLTSDWGALLTGRFQLQSQSITDIRRDRDGRGVWLSFHQKKPQGVSHLLLDREKEIFLIYVAEDHKGKKIAEVTYGNRMPADPCQQPLDINITGLDYGTEIHLALENVVISEEKNTYRLASPPGYNRQDMP